MWGNHRLTAFHSNCCLQQLMQGVVRADATSDLIENKSGGYWRERCRASRVGAPRYRLPQQRVAFRCVTDFCTHLVTEKHNGLHLLLCRFRHFFFPFSTLSYPCQTQSIRKLSSLPLHYCPLFSPSHFYYHHPFTLPTSPPLSFIPPPIPIISLPSPLLPLFPYPSFPPALLVLLCSSPKRW
jgi:hypothetical protein